MTKINIRTWSFIAFFTFFFVNGGLMHPQETLPETQFRNADSENSAPWTFWYWMYGAISKEGITADLEAMKEIGLGGAYLMSIRGPEDNKSESFSPAYTQLTPEWWEFVRFSMEEADRLDLKLGMHICDGFALAGGPWITPEKSMQKVVWNDTILSGGNIRNLRLSQPETVEGYYNDIALYAVPVSDTYSTHRQTPDITSSNPDDEKPLYLADNTISGTFRSSAPCWIQYAFKEPFLCRSLKIVPGGNNFQAQRLSVFASDDGISFHKIKELQPPRQGWQNTDTHFTFAVPATRARYFRFYWNPDGTEPGAEDLDAAKWRPNLRVNKIFLSGNAIINQFEGKNGSVWRLAARTQADELPDDACVKLRDIVSIPLSLLNGNVLNTKLPRGKWKIIRMGHTSTGHTNATGGGGKGLECDKFSKEAVSTQLENWFGATFTKTDPALARKVLKYMHVDSWECGSQNWSTNFLEEFCQRRGYDLTPYLPVYAGIPIDNAEKTESILHDIRQTIAELVVDVFFKTLADFARRHDCEFSAECVSPTMMSDGMMHYQMVDRPMGEFWLESPTHDKFNDMLDAVSGAHIYEKQYVQAEGFTQLRTKWNETPRTIKPLLDRNFALGVNKLFHHVYAHNPYTDKAPGMTLDGIGLYFQRDQTWWTHARAWIDYVNRCQTLLRFGRPVVDIAVFTGEETPRRALLPERLVNSLPGIFGEEKVQWEKNRLANKEQPLRVMPVGVTHSANITDASDWIDPLNGYAYDSFNKDALLRLAKAKDGKLTLPGGMYYNMLVLPKPHSLSPDGAYMSVEVAEKVRELQKGGVIVLLGDKPLKIPGFNDKERSTEKMTNLSNEIWSVSPEYILPYNEGDFVRFGLEKDIDFNGEKEVAWTHRASDNTDVYFVSNQKSERRNLSVSFRSTGKQPELWNPVNGEIANIRQWETDGKRISVNLTLEPHQSMFVVFRNPATEKKSDIAVSSETKPLKTGDWNIDFVNEPSINLSTKELFDWSNEKDDRIKYYAGTAVYTTNIHWNGHSIDKKILLDVGEVNDMAEIFMNDIHCGIIWTFPHRVDITKALRKGNNMLRISVVNSWANKIKGVHDGKIADDAIWTNAPFRPENRPLQPSGLSGPLQIII